MERQPDKKSFLKDVFLEAIGLSDDPSLAVIDVFSLGIQLANSASKAASSINALSNISSANRAEPVARLVESDLQVFANIQAATLGCFSALGICDNPSLLLLEFERFLRLIIQTPTRGDVPGLSRFALVTTQGLIKPDTDPDILDKMQQDQQQIDGVVQTAIDNIA
ncbi:hypothetical protein Clacol_005943 [Clathrus columnatus]|uniref:Uncharacterized protein n=1 Tax=Clathrus columnatus TaxID=1419009 RepID=A0AAV5ADD2_9AGAM|nr:hypothetical protein Clacol_005943 [Clathrus columnatus]